MTVRQALPEDLPAVVAYGAEFHAASVHRGFPLDIGAFAGFAARLIDDGGVFLSDTGFIGGALVPLYFSPAVLIAAELFWFTKAEGAALREAFEGWARSRGAAVVQFSSMADERERAVARVLRCAGYAPAETSYLKVL